MMTTKFSLFRKSLYLGLVCALTVASQWAVAETPRKLSKSQIERLQRDGDRLADQGDFQGALEYYTQAYLGVVSGIRGQAFVQNVLPNLYNREELGAEMLRMMAEEYTAEELLLMDSSFKVFGFLQPDQDSQSLMTRLLTEEVAGFYDPDAKRMVLIVEDGPVADPGWFGRLLGARPAFDKDEQKTTLAHELTHALQDQLYDLNAMEANIAQDDDMLLAFSALVEGDATLLMFAEAQGTEDLAEMDPDVMRTTFNMMSWLMPVAGGQAYREAPPIFRDSLVFPYFQGMLFVLSQAAQGGWEGVHEIYSSPPLSTEQILHPKKYAEGENRDVPQSVHLPDLADVLHSNWKSLGGNCLGELQTSILLGKVIGGKNAARGWDGDRYEVYRSGAGKLAMISVSIWDSPQDAEEFATAFARYRDLTLPAATGQAESESTAINSAGAEKDAGNTAGNANQFQLNQPIKSAEDEVFEAGSYRMVKLQDDTVWIVEGLDQPTIAAVGERLSQTTFSEKTFWVPQEAAGASAAAEVLPATRTGR
ncbi:hypothetical protein [Aureliella helgolandensis]|uniref:Uncharacterized protein n=1 Tax=Aureliella helgolandensis TaxID=2527968 RepID=A0A518G8D7_9BACT|nr:hypothetical protein [Aureliella helgolandensis]QDV24843.1 hypothetical protein Q31a_31650 [Aureliella helgolandensis]